LTFVFLFFFFFSSRRRHTRFSRDWSSDVCSSDLTEMIVLPSPSFLPLWTALATGSFVLSLLFKFYWFSLVPLTATIVLWYFWTRSEERRVGKECRSRWSAGD